MHIPTKSNGNQTFHSVLYDRALHPELFILRARRVLRVPGSEAEAWIIPGGHVVRYQGPGGCASELITPMDRRLPTGGVINAAMCSGDHEFEHELATSKIGYMTSSQCELLSDALYLATYEELAAHGRNLQALVHEWEDDSGRSMSIVDLQRHGNEVHVEAYHLLAGSGMVVRTQSLFAKRAIAQPA